MQFHKTAAGVLVFLVLFAAAPAQADPVAVTDGLVTLDSGDPHRFTFTTDTFSIFAVGGYSGTDFAPYRDCFVGFCTAGMPFDPSAQITRDPLNATDAFRGAVLNGVEYPEAVVDGHILISGPPGIVPNPEDEFPRATFGGLTLDAFLTVYADASRSGTPLLVAELSGSGILRARFVRGFEPGRVEALDLSYQFGQTDPVPEPGTLLLFASGAACLWKRRRVRAERASVAG